MVNLRKMPPDQVKTPDKVQTREHEETLAESGDFGCGQVKWAKILHHFCQSNKKMHRWVHNRILHTHVIPWHKEPYSEGIFCFMRQKLLTNRHCLSRQAGWGALGPVGSRYDRLNQQISSRSTIACRAFSEARPRHILPESEVALGFSRDAVKAM